MDRDDLAPFLAHGGRVEAARARFGGEDWIDLSTGIAPWRYPVAHDLRLDRLPEPGEIAALERAAACAFGVADPGHVVAVQGTDLALRLLARIVPARRPAVVRPGYAGHAAAWPGALGVRSVGEVASSVEEAPDLLVLASPSNPAGVRADAEGLRALSARATVVLDEAYADPDHSLAPEASDALIVLRSFGKFYGLPGLRLGFVVAGPTVVAALRAMLGDWPVGSAATVIGTRAYGDDEWRGAQAERITAMGAALDARLDHAGIAIVGRAGLFRLVAVADAAGSFRRCAAHAILTRPFADAPGWLRLGLPADVAGLDRLTRALEDGNQ